MEVHDTVEAVGEGVGVAAIVAGILVGTRIGVARLAGGGRLDADRRWQRPAAPEAG